MAYNTATISSIPKPVSEDHITRYIRLRLAALKTNPEAFGSTFAADSTLSREQWCGRINKPRTTFFATSVSSAIADISLERDAGSHLGSKWIGTLSLLEPELVHDLPFPSKIAEAKDGGAEIYMLVGMWVDPEFRKKGVGGQLVEHALQAVRDFSVISSHQNRGENDGRKRLVVLEVHNTNFVAQRLYESQGFVVEPEVTKEGMKWMALNII